MAYLYKQQMHRTTDNNSNGGEGWLFNLEWTTPFFDVIQTVIGMFDTDY